MTFSHRIRNLAIFLVILLFLLSIQVIYWPLVRGQALQPVVFDPQSAPAQYGVEQGEAGQAPLTLADLPLPVRLRTIRMLGQIKRGSISDRSEVVLAQSQEDGNGNSVRSYSDPSFAHVLGYVSAGVFGVSGIESTLNETLLGLDRFESNFNQVIRQPIRGSDVSLTIDRRVQQTAAQALGDRAGAVVVMDANTGAILGMVSTPTFDANALIGGASGLDTCTGTVGCESVLVNRATQGLYPPGSVWKTVTLIAALESGQATPETEFDSGAPQFDANGLFYVYEVDGATIEDRNHEEQILNLSRSYALSANTTFARLADEMDPDTLITYARRFGFSREDGRPPIEIEANSAQLANNVDDLYLNNVLRASSGIGQGEVLASPLSMALLVSAVVNDGDIPTPHLLQAVRSPSGRVLEDEPSGDWIRNTMRAETAQQVRQMMIEVVNNGTGTQAALPGITVGGKTGTAQLDGDQFPHAWFIGFAEKGEQRVAIAVVVENGGEGSLVAAPIFAQVAQVAIE